MSSRLEELDREHRRRHMMVEEEFDLRAREASAGDMAMYGNALMPYMPAPPIMPPNIAKHLLGEALSPAGHFKPVHELDEEKLLLLEPLT